MSQSRAGPSNSGHFNELNCCIGLSHVADLRHFDTCRTHVASELGEYKKALSALAVFPIRWVSSAWFEPRTFQSEGECSTD